MKKLILYAVIGTMSLSCTGQNNMWGSPNLLVHSPFKCYLENYDKRKYQQKDAGYFRRYDRIKDIPKPNGYHSKYNDDYSNMYSNFRLKVMHIANDPVVRDRFGENVGSAAYVLNMSLHRYQDCAASAMQLHALASDTTIIVHDSKNRAYPIKPEMGKNTASFSMCNSYSINKHDLIAVHHLDSVMPGDLLVYGGHPGHVAVIMEVIENASGNIQVMIGNGWLPALDFHIVSDTKLSDVWFDFSRIVKNHENISISSGAAGWDFKVHELRRWKYR